MSQAQTNRGPAPLTGLMLPYAVERALANGEFYVEFQPIVALGTSSIIGAEALLRWSQPDFGAVPPTAFIPAAEWSGSIVALGRFVLRAAIQAASEWPLMANGSRPFLNVNVSGRELAEPDYAEFVVALCSEFEVARGGVRLEVLESFFDATGTNVEANLLALRAHGILIVVDDFGSGFSDHLRIASVGASIIKIDRSLTETIRATSDPLDTAELAAILADAATRRIEVIAEGVETSAQVGWYAAHGCASAQGFYFSPAIASDKIAKLIEGGGVLHG